MDNMDNVLQQQENNNNNNKGLAKMKMDKIKRIDNMSDAINKFILGSEFLTQYIVDRVLDEIYTKKSYDYIMITDVIENDLNNSYSLGYIIDGVIDEIDIYSLTDSIDNLYREDFIQLAKDCNN